jgi:cellulose synthase/poly-beta-1,6-N-acetylglucosamine synthase-like glycosyltransferase
MKDVVQSFLKLPPGPIMTKPRALNYGLEFCSVDIVGIYDAEDRPDPNQIEQAVAKFATSPSDVVCLQGVLDTYNSDANWLTRCFTVEYAVWFRLILPGMVNLGMAIPLGGHNGIFAPRRAERNGWVGRT